MRTLIVLLAALSLAACSDPGDKDGENNGWTLNNDNPDMGGDGGNNTTDGGPGDAGGDGGTVDTGPDMPPTKSVEFRLINRSDEALFAHHSAGSNSPCVNGAFVQVIDESGTSHALSSDCTMCSCDQEACAICEIDCAPGVEAEHVQFGADDVRSFTWDGLFRAVDTHPNGGTCFDEQPPQSDNLTARFCWGRGFTSLGGPDNLWGDITDIECQEVEFSMSDDVVEFEIQPTAREAIRFELVNAGTETLYASIGFDSPCIVDEWLRLDAAGDPLLVTLPCGECMCNEVNADSMCPLPCPAACAAPTPELYEFPPGDMRLFDWNRTHYVRDQVDGVMCLDDRRSAGEVTATFCWATGFDELSLSLVGEQCDSVTLDPSVDTLVRHEVN